MERVNIKIFQSLWVMHCWVAEDQQIIQGWCSSLLVRDYNTTPPHFLQDELGKSLHLIFG
jgi:hypothetical protein